MLSMSSGLFEVSSLWANTFVWPELLSPEALELFVLADDDEEEDPEEYEADASGFLPDEFVLEFDDEEELEEWEPLLVLGFGADSELCDDDELLLLPLLIV